MKKLWFLLALILTGAFQASADEGMWLPSEILKKIKDIQSQGFKLSAEDIYSINRSSLKDAVVRFGGGCTGELISPEGLLITNHHCGFGQIQSHSSVEHDYLTDGFWAMSKEEELPNPGLSVSFLEYMEDVTDQVLKGYKPKMTEEKRNELVAKNCKKIEEKAVKGQKGLVANVKPLYYGNRLPTIQKAAPSIRAIATPTAISACSFARCNSLSTACTACSATASVSGAGSPASPRNNSVRVSSSAPARGSSRETSGKPRPRSHLDTVV